MATPARPLAKCVVRWIYEQASWVLQQLKKQLLRLIDLIDAQILALRAWAAQYDILAQIEQAAWNAVEGFINDLMSELSAMPTGPMGELCPEFVAYFTDPLLGLLETFMRSTKFMHEDINSVLSYMDELDLAISYWDAVKQDLVAAIDIIDAALYEALMAEAEAVP